MAVENVKCPNCGATLNYDGWNRRYVCEYCNCTYRDKKEKTENNDTKVFNVPRPEIQPEDLEKLEDIIGGIEKELLGAFDYFTKKVIPTVLIVVLSVILLIILFVFIIL